MINMLTPSGAGPLASALQRRPLLALDFDGTVSPLVPDPDAARIAPEVPPLLENLARRMPVALVSGRGLADLRKRASVPGVTLVGNHGNEWDEPRPQAASAQQARARAIADWTQQLAAPLAALGQGIAFEVKTQSLSVHYRLMPDPAAARQRLLDIAATLRPVPTLLEGKSVLNLLAPGLVTKYEAVAELVERHHCGTAIFLGDDITDEHVFEKAPPHWIGVRVWDLEVGRDAGSSHARYAVDGVDGVIALLRRIDSLTNL